MPKTKKTTTTKTTTATKTQKGAKLQTKTKTKKIATTKAEKIEPESNIVETPKYSQIILDYNRFGNIGFSHMRETVDISFLTKKKFTGKISTLFHFLRNTSVAKNLDTGKTATFQIDNKSILSITQKAGNFDEGVFAVTKYKPDGSKQSTRGYSYIKTKNLVLDAFGFDVQIDEGEDVETSNEDMEIQLESANYENDSNTGFDEID